MWVGRRVPSHRSTICLYFSGACKNISSKPAGGYGFWISLNDQRGDELVRAYGYGGKNCTRTEMEYLGMIQGLIWALRLAPLNLKVYGDSETLVKMNNREQANDPKIEMLFQEAKGILEQRSEASTITFHPLKPENKQIVDYLADSGIESKENLTICNWPNVNRQLFDYDEIQLFDYDEIFGCATLWLMRALWSG